MVKRAFLHRIILLVVLVFVPWIGIRLYPQLFEVPPWSSR
jgi:hypothetical protein